jgi:hypothetical protein
MRLDYGGAERCPDAAFFRDRVAFNRPSHVDPFAADAPARLVVTLGHDATGYRGRWDAFDATGKLVRMHNFGPVSSCIDAVEGLAFGFVLRFDDPTAPQAPPTPNPAPSPSPLPVIVPPAPPRDAPKPPAAPPSAGRVMVGLSGLLGLATMPAPAGGGVLAVGWRAPRWWSVSAELRGLLGLNAPVDGGHHVSLHRVTGAAVPCLHWRWLFGCGVLELGELGGTSDAEVPASASAFIMTAGGRIGAEIPIGSLFAFRAAVDGFGAIKPAVVRISGEPRWETPGGGALAALGVVALF